jgi:CheY-like chemotaxis protein
MSLSGAIRLLLVEPHPEARETLTELLQALGYSVAAAATLQEPGPGVEPPDLIITAGALPEGRGGALFCGAGRWARIPAIALVTADGAPLPVRYPFVDRLEKPISLPELHQAILTALPRELRCAA